MKPGDIVEYKLSYRNESRGRMRNLKANLPIPHGMAYIDGSAVPARLKASTDGTTFGTPPLRKKVRGPDGKEAVVVVPPTEYRFLQWTVDALEPGGSVVFTARMRVAEVSR